MLEGQNTFAPTLSSAFYVTDGQKMRDQTTRGRKVQTHVIKLHSNAMCIPFIHSGGPNECWLRTFGAWVIKTWRLGLRAPLLAHKYSYH